MSWQRYRNVIEERPVSDYVDRVRSDWDRFDEAWEALKWFLVRRADTVGLQKHVQDKVYRLYRQAGDVLANTPDIVVLYATDENNITLYGVRVRDRL